MYKDMLGLAMRYSGEKQVEKHAFIGEVVAVLVTKSKKKYIGKSIKMTCSLGMCAETSAIANMINDDETEISDMLALYNSIKPIPPCGRCRELLYQLNHRNLNCNIHLGENHVIKLSDLLPVRWDE